MKQPTTFLLLFGALFFAQTNLFAQQPNHISAAFLPILTGSTILELLPDQNGSVRIWGISGNGIWYYQFDSTGTNKHVAQWDYLTQEISFQPAIYGDGILSYSLGYDCDYIPPTFLRKWNLEAEIVWEHQLEPSENISFMPKNDSMFWLFIPKDNKVELRSYLTGEVLSDTIIVQTNFDRYIELATGKVLTYGKNGLVLYNRSLSEKLVVLPGKIIQDVDTLTNGNTVVLSDSLYLLGQDLQVLGREQLPSLASGDNWSGIETEGNQMYLVRSSSTSPAWIECDSNLQVVQTNEIPDASLFQVIKFAVRDSTLYLGGDHTSAKAIKILPLAPPTYRHFTDVALISLTSVDSIQYEKTSSSSYSMTWSNVEVVIRNTGETYIDRVALSSIFSVFVYICPIVSSYFGTFTGLDLAPGTSTTVVIDELAWSGIGFSPFPPLTATVQMCAMLPQDSIDTNFPNNCVVGQAPVKVLVSTETPEIRPVRAYPNPATETFVIELPQNVALPVHVTIFGPTGQQIAMLGASEHQIRLERGQLPAGLYCARLQTEKGASGVVKWIWE